MAAVINQHAYHARLGQSELVSAGREVTQAVAAPAGEPSWRSRARRRLAGLRELLTEHVVATEGPDGLYAALREHAPRLTRPVAVLAAEHETLLARVDALARRLQEADCQVEAVRADAQALLGALSRHRQRGADLVYEAYDTDIGGET